MYIALITRCRFTTRARFAVSAYELHLGYPVVVQLEAAIDAGNPVVAVPQLTITDQEANPGLFRYVPEAAQDADIGFLAAQRIARFPIQTRRLIVYQYAAKTIVSGTTSEAHAAFRIDDAPGKYQGRSRGEEIRILNEEGPPFRKLHFESLIDGNLGLIGFYLAEIGIQRQVEHHGIVKNKFRIQAHILLGRGVEAWSTHSISFYCINIARKQKRNKLKIITGRHIRDSSQQCGLVQTTLDI